MSSINESIVPVPSQSRTSSVLIILSLLVLCVGFLISSAGAANIAEYGRIDAMEIVDPDLPAGFRKYDRITVEVNITQGGPGDVYLLKKSEYVKLNDNEPFKPAVAKERINHTKFTWEKPDDDTYYLVIDNQDNARGNDAIPYEDITYEYTAPIEERHNEVISQQIWMTGLIIAIIIIAATILVVLRILRR
jgi:hypothetical protein